MKNSVISIIVPVYKVERELDRCVKSLLAQTYPFLEIILVDDGSPDKCPIICDEYAKADNRIKVIHKENGGLSDARNAGLKIATGKYVMYVDSDDYIESDACERLIKVAEELHVDFVIGACKEIRKGSVGYQRHSNIQEGKIYIAKEVVINSIKANEWYAPACFNLYNKEFLLAHNLFFLKGYLYEDMDMLLRLYLAADKVAYLDYAFYNYIIREDSITTSSVSKAKREMALEIYRRWKKTIDGLADEEYKKYLYGILVRYYLRTCYNLKIDSWKIAGINCKFAWKYALNFKERIKVLFFTLLPKLYIKESVYR